MSPSGAPSMIAKSDVRCVPLTPELWPALERLFGAHGACGGCWCMWWRVERGGKTWKDIQGAKAKRHEYLTFA